MNMKFANSFLITAIMMVAFLSSSTGVDAARPASLRGLQQEVTETDTEVDTEAVVEMDTEMYTEVDTEVDTDHTEIEVFAQEDEPSGTEADTAPDTVTKPETEFETATDEEIESEFDIGTDVDTESEIALVADEPLMYNTHGYDEEGELFTDDELDDEEVEVDNTDFEPYYDIDGNLISSPPDAL